MVPLLTFFGGCFKREVEMGGLPGWRQTCDPWLMIFWVGPLADRFWIAGF